MGKAGPWAGLNPDTPAGHAPEGHPAGDLFMGRGFRGGVNEEPFDSQTRSGQALNEECEDNEE